MNDHVPGPDRLRKIVDVPEQDVEDGDGLSSIADLVRNAGAGGAGRPGGSPETDEARDLRLAGRPTTDLGNSERLRDRFGGDFRYCPSSGWHQWDGRRWARDGAEEAIERAAQDVARAIGWEAVALAKAGGGVRTDKRKKSPAEALASWGRASESAARCRAMVEMARPHLVELASAFDSDPWAFNTMNGTLRFRRTPGDGDPVSFHPHRREDLNTKCSPVAFDPDAICPAFDRFLTDIQPDPAMRRFLLQWAGYSLTGDTGEQKFVFLYGKGKNGKSTLVDALAYVAGDYGATVPIETFTDSGRGRTAGAATPDLAMLPGVRMLRASEPEKRSHLAEAFIKAVTGGEPVTARHLNRDYFSFKPDFKLTLSGNYRPAVDGVDEGIWRRVTLVPFAITIAEPDPGLAAKLRAEAPGILNRCLDGLRDWIEHGMRWPQQVIEATAEYRVDSDPLGRFLAECVVPRQGNREAVASVHRVYLAWARANGEAAWSAKGLGAAMRERGFRTVHSTTKKWDGVMLIRHEIDFAADVAGHDVDED